MQGGQVHKVDEIIKSTSLSNLENRQIHGMDKFAKVDEFAKMDESTMDVHLTTNITLHTSMRNIIIN